MKKVTRELQPNELKVLQKIRTATEKELKNVFKPRQFLIAIGVGAVCMVIANWTAYDVITFLFGAISVLSFGFVIFAPYEIYKVTRKGKKRVEEIREIEARGTLEVSPVTARRIAVAKEYEDEGDLFVIEMDDKKVLYLWDHDRNLKKGFPCLMFDIYDEQFCRIVGRQVNPLSEKIKPLVIDAKAKWAYLQSAGPPENLSVEKKDFDKVVERMQHAKKK